MNLHLHLNGKREPVSKRPGVPGVIPGAQGGPCRNHASQAVSAGACALAQKVLRNQSESAKINEMAKESVELMKMRAVPSREIMGVPHHAEGSDRRRQSNGAVEGGLRVMH